MSLTGVLIERRGGLRFSQLAKGTLAIESTDAILDQAMEFASRPWENASPADNSYQNKMNW